MKRKVICILIDGVSADYFAKHREMMPYANQMANNGILVERLKVDMAATSLPGRASMITGTTADQHGIYGNRIFGGDTFRYANPDDVRVPGLARQASDAGLDVASIGYTMTKPEDCSLFLPPWWVNAWIQRGRDQTPLAVHPSWKRVLDIKDDNNRLNQILSSNPAVNADNPSPWLTGDTLGMQKDQKIMQWVTQLACSDHAPDLILTEINMPDEVQHDFGFASSSAHWSIASGDTMVGNLLNALHECGRDEEYVVALASDHGHTNINTAIYAEMFTNDHRWASEGSVLHVVVPAGDARNEISNSMRDLGVEEIDSTHVPSDMRQDVATYLCPEGFDFESKPAGAPADAVTGPARFKSNHGLRPNHPHDHRMCVFAGANLPAQQHGSADAVQFTSTLAALMGLDVSGYEGEPIVAG